ncbi:MAG: WG repeat-containing protein [Clostridia bacterium]|nr:WG repeat-containing protein [Clostridia bacterium]MBR4458039.1 WG repeat-containing protein [Clostridia bacterium]
MSVNLSTGVAKEIESIQTMASFSEGLAAVQNTERKWGYIDAEGELVIDYQFDEADPFHDGQAIVIINYKKHKVDKQGNIT